MINYFCKLTIATCHNFWGELWSGIWFWHWVIINFPFLVEILNAGSEQTFQNSAWQEVLHIILCSRGLMGEVSSWMVSKESSLPDGRHIIFNLDWAYGKNSSDELQGRTETFLGRYGIAVELEVPVDFSQKALTRIYENNCPLRIQASGNALLFLINACRHWTLRSGVCTTEHGKERTPYTMKPTKWPRGSINKN